MNKRGYYFTLDALIALTIIFSVLLTINHIDQEETNPPIIQRDFIESLSSIKIANLNNSYAENLREENKTTSRLTVLEQISEYHARDMQEGKKLTESILNDTDTEKNIGIWFEDELIASSNDTKIQNAREVWASNQIIRGIKKSEENSSIRGYSAKTYLRQGKNKKYHYFGGYVGEGNISLRVYCEGNVEELILEIATNKDFDVYINGEFSGHYENSSSERNPSEYDLSSYSDRFQEGENIIKLAEKDLYVAGGFLRVGYNKSQPYNQSERYYFPGISGVVNLYDGLHIPGNLTEMSVSLHMKSNYSTFLKIGNKTVFNGSTSGEQNIKINDSELSSKLKYNRIEKKTIPLRLGMHNMSYVEKIRKNADVFSVTDLSGSMCGTCSGADSDCCSSWWGGDTCNNDQIDCEDCNGTCEDKIYKAKDANDMFVDSILNLTGNRAGLVGYRGDIFNSDCHNLSKDNESLKNKIDEWYANGGTCICCGVNNASDRMARISEEDKVKAMVVMSDGEANYECSEQNTGDPKQDAIQSACDAYNDHGVVVHTVGFGDNADEETLKSMANCTGGIYKKSNISNIVEIYDDIAENIIEASYEEQTINTSEEVLTKLYPDSYINFQYDKRNLPHGLFVTSESDSFNSSSQTSFYVPENSTVVNAESTSYSGPKWTKSLKIYNNSWNTVYNISKYSNDYTEIGDPYTVQIPPKKIEEGNNRVELRTGISQKNDSSSSTSDKVVYTIIKDALGYSPISSSSKGCNWTIELYDSSKTNIEIPEGNNNTQECYYTNSKVSYDENDAVSTATYNLLKELDFDSDNRIDSKFSRNDLDIETSGINNIPYTYGTKIEVRTWR